MPVSSSQTTSPPQAEPDPLRRLMQMIREQGDVVQYQSSYGPVHFFNHPDQVQAILLNPGFQRTALLKKFTGEGLLASDGSHWQSRRRLLQPPFHEKCLHGFVPLIVQATMETLRRWEKIPKSDDTIDLGRESKRLTLEIILRVLFVEISEDEVNRMAEATYVVMQYLGDLSDVVLNVPLLIDPGRETQFRDAMAVIDAVIAELTGRTKFMDGHARGVVPTLLEARDKGAITDRDVRDEIVTMIIAGHETSAIALPWTLYLLTGHPEVEARLVDEVECVLQDPTPSPDDVSRLSYTRMVFDEAMRLYPPVSLVVRQAEKEETVSGVRIPPGGLAMLSAYTTHRHPDVWQDPERFDPERFHPDRSRSRHRYAYFPFLGGRHACLGQGLALLEAPMILALLMRHVRIGMQPGSIGNPLPGMALRVRGGFPATVEFRKPLS